jgi:hypothetical protein
MTEKRKRKGEDTKVLVRAKKKDETVMQIVGSDGNDRHTRIQLLNKCTCSRDYCCEDRWY